MKLTRRSLLGTFAAASLSPAFGQAYPNKVTSIIVPFAAGGTADIFGRMVGEHLAKTLGQPFIVENVVGAGSIVGISRVAKSTPDGYTLGVASTSGLSINPGLYGKKLAYNPEKDLIPVSQVSIVPNVLVVNPEKIKAKNVAELIVYLKANPNKVSFGSSGIGTSQHLAAELFMQMTDTKMVHVPYRGSSQLVTDLLGGQIELAFDNVPLLLPHVAAGKLTALATCTEKRADFDKNLPAMSETLAGFEAVAWHGFVAPAGTQEAIIDKLSSEISAFMKQPETLKKFAELGSIAVSGSSKDFTAYIASETTKWSKVIQTANIKVD
jgi:tripartite-type tricarboxylate transporter receptor subunit TctC